MGDPMAWALLAGAGLVAGVLNALAGGGSLLTLPALIFLGLPADVANGTNRVGVLLQCAASTATYQRSGRMPWGQAPLSLVPSVLGAGVGATLALSFDAATLKPVFGALLMAALPSLFLRPLDPERARSRRGWAWLGLFLCGVYGGFVQAGVGIFLLLVLTGLQGLPLFTANALKMLVVGAFTLPALVLFASHDLVQWGPGLVLSAGSMVGGVLGSRFHLEGKESWVRAVVVATVVASSGRLLQWW
jgi:hypothetical protein